MIKNINDTLVVNFYKDNYYKDFTLSPGFSIEQFIPGNANAQESDRVLDLLSDNKKLYFYCLGSIYPFFVHLDSVLSFYEDKEKVDNVELIVDINEVGSYNYGHWLSEILNNKKIKHKIVNSGSYKYVNINNFYVIDGISLSKDGVFHNFYNNTLSFVPKNKIVKPFRKVFISRKFAYTDNTNVRIDDHEKLEQIFLDSGFEICYPESQFKTFSEQVTYFNETKVLCGISGGGLTNSVFMQPKGKILELLTSFRFYYSPQNNNLIPKLTEELHEYYLQIAFQNKHTIVTLSNVDRESVEIEKELKATGVLEWLTRND